MHRIISIPLILGLSIPGIPAQSREEKPKVYTNEDLPPLDPVYDREPRSPESTSDGPDAAMPEIPSSAEIRDRNRHGEGWWRLRAAEIDLLLLDAEIRAQELHVQNIRGKTLTDPTIPVRLKEATETLLELREARDRLPEELRTAGGMPGWLRRGEDSWPDEILPAPLPGPPTFGDDITLSWQAVPGAGFYIVELQYDDCGGFLDDCDLQTLDVSVPHARFPSRPGSSGRWRVRPLDPAGFPGEWSAWNGFEQPGDTE